MEETSRPSLLFGFSVAAIFVLSLALSYFLAFESSSLLVTIPILFLSTIFVFTFSKQKVVSRENSVEDSGPAYKLEEKEVTDKVTSEVESVFQCQESEEVCVLDEYLVESTDFPSDSESSTDDYLAGENFELNWIHSNNVVQNVSAISSSSTSDDEHQDEDDDDSLIEINLPSSDSAGVNEDSKKKLPDFLPDSIFRQEGLEEFLAEIYEVNEEENLIEIDLSIGSIKFPRFEIET